MFKSWILEQRTIVEFEQQANMIQFIFLMGKFPGGSDGLQCERPAFDPWVGKIP